MFNLKISSEQIKYVITILVTTIITAIFCTVLIVKSPFRELNRYLKEPEKFKFIDILNLLSSDIISLVLLMLVILLYYHAFSNIGLHRGFSYNLKYEINKL